MNNLTIKRQKVCNTCFKNFMGTPNRRYCNNCSNFKCELCNKSFSRRTDTNKFCSLKCARLSWVGKPTRANWTPELKAKMSKKYMGKGNPMYGKENWAKGKKRPEMSGINHFAWKGGFSINKDGYKVIENELETHGEKIFEHRLVMEQNLGRKLLFSEIIHHINHNKLDNRIENLMIVSRTEHVKIHPAWKLSI